MNCFIWMKSKIKVGALRKEIKSVRIRCIVSIIKIQKEQKQNLHALCTKELGKAMAPWNARCTCLQFVRHFVIEGDG